MAALNSSSIFIAKSDFPAVFPSSSWGMSRGSIDFESRGLRAGNMKMDAGRSKLRLVCAVGGSNTTGNSNSSSSSSDGRWCGEIRDLIFSENGSVTVVYRVTIRGSDGEAYRESTGTVSSSDALLKILFLQQRK
ncbi:hypothetical protein GH714_007563 [Hevea brasiliensis]|uniref:Uncharacterized protein n=1 Tax=Hevea brasiliensis TaxID=3981 RepID=A0A6A6KHR3_HEVBR|nr:hypothetical protein GH714_007563 [Hevea brasiliensis]